MTTQLEYRLSRLTEIEKTAMRGPIAPRIELVSSLRALADQFILKSHEVSTGQEQLRRQGAQVRSAAQMVWNGTYDLTIGNAWADAARLTLRTPPEPTTTESLTGPELRELQRFRRRRKSLADLASA